LFANISETIDVFKDGTYKEIKYSCKSIFC